MKFRFKRIFFVLIIPALLGGLIHYTISYKIKNILQILVEQRSENTYSFKASKIEVSFLKKSFIVEKAQFISLDSTKAKTHYNIDIPKMYLGITSWSGLLFNHKASIDSLSFVDSKISVHEKSPLKIKTNTDIHLGNVFSTIDNLLQFLEVKSFCIQNGSFVYKTIHSKKILSGTGINFSIRNLSEKNKKGHLLYSEDIRINIENQVWELPDGIHTIRFKNLNFSGKNQFFELDSCTIHAAANKEQGETNLHAEKLFFNSLEFSSMYEKNILLIDTLLCIKPTLTLTSGSKKNKSKDTTNNLSALLPSLFKAARFNYINIEDGQLILQSKTNSSANTFFQKSNLKIYKLALDENSKPHFKTDSILFGLKNIEFVTPDSTFKIIASELMIINNDLVLRNSFFGPTNKTIQNKSISFSSPEFRLKDIDFISLIQKRLNADRAELYSPRIYIKSTRSTQKKSDDAVPGIERFYSSLHEFRELVGLDTLEIFDGSVTIENPEKHNTKMHMKGINATILPIHFVNSDSLVDIKHSMPIINIAEIWIKSDNIDLKVNRFTFDGVHRKNHADYVHLLLKDEIDIEAYKLYWEIFDWDLFQKYKRIQITDFEAQTLSVKTKHDALKKSTREPGKDLPDVRIGKLKVNNLYLHSTIGTDLFSLSGHDIDFDSIRSAGHFFTWEKVHGIFEDIYFNQKDLHANVKYLQFATHSKTIIKNISFDKKNIDSEIHIQIPSLTISGDIYSTDFSELDIQKIHAENPKINYRSLCATGIKTRSAFLIPLNFNVKEVAISNAHMDYEKESDNDTLAASIDFTVQLSDLITSKENTESVRYSKLDLKINKLLIIDNHLALHVPSASMRSNQGSIRSDQKKNHTFSSDLSVEWNKVRIDKDLVKTNAVLNIKDLSGSFNNKTFTYTTNKTPKLNTLLNHVSITDGAVTYSNSRSIVEANKISWHNSSNTLALHSFSYNPKRSREESFKQATSQFDYLTLSGMAIKIKGFHVSDNTDDSLIHIEKIMLDRLTLTSARDKNLPRKKVKPKEMPTKIIQSIPWPIEIDSIEISDSKVLVHQIEAKSKEEVIIPIEHINALITTVSNRNTTKDSLRLIANAHISDVKINMFKYTESYADSLSYFHAYSSIVPGKFTSLNSMTVPLASLAIDNGYSNSLQAEWAGNKYAAIGQMDFIYKDLAIHLLHKGDSSQTNFGLFLENKIADDLIKTNNTKSSVIFFERNTEKQIFNYWLKATMQGVYSAVGIKSNQKYLKHYKKVKLKYHLPKNPVVS